MVSMHSNSFALSLSKGPSNELEFSSHTYSEHP